MVGTYPPAQCGIATFTADLSNSIAVANPKIEVDIFAIKAQAEMHYSDMVFFEINEQSQADYFEAAQLINSQGYDAVSVQHEYGIFGGVAGSFLLDLMRNLKVPIVTTLHTVLDEPSLSQKLVLEAVLDCSERIIVMSEKAIGLLTSIHGIDTSKVEVIPHGIPVIPKTTDQKFRLGIPSESPMILTFGLLSPDKGIEFVIEAMPEIVKACPGATYAVVGATHPHILSANGEIYRNRLISLAADLGVSENVKFINQFVPLEDIVGYLSAMDIYITPYLKPNQITSGTLAYAVGAGKAVISTPYWYAEELLAEGRGTLVPFRDVYELAKAVISIENNPNARKEMGEKALEFGQSMLWSEVGTKYVESILNAIDQFEVDRKIKTRVTHTSAVENHLLPSLNTFHLREISDNTGILQHAIHSVPLRSEGYCVDDNARALLFTALIEQQGELPTDLDLAQSSYLSFVLDAFNVEGGRFRNFMSYQRDWLEQEGSEDSHARTLWALGTLICKGQNQYRREAALRYFKDALPAFEHISSPRSWAYAVLGADEYLTIFPHDVPVRVFMHKMASRLLTQYEIGCSGDWLWFEDSVTYANARLPQALMVAGHSLLDERMLKAGLQSLEWLKLIQTNKGGLFSPIGSETFYVKGETRSEYDQQPIEAAASVSSYLTAWKITGHSIWLAEAHRAFQWFLGANILGVPVYDEMNGGCCDGLHPDRINKNQGAESTVSFLTALTELRTAIFPPSTKTPTRAQHETI